MNPRAVFPADSQPLARRAALTVHALGGMDRAWLLAQLPDAERKRLQPMLEELKALGIPADRSLLDEVVGAVPAGPAASQARIEIPPDLASGRATQQDALSRLDPAVVVKLLQAEPAGLIAQVLCIQAWPWRQGVLEQLAPVKRRRVEEILDSLRRQVRPKVPEALHKALVEALHGRTGDSKVLAQQGPAPKIAARTASSHGSRWIARLPGWLQPLSRIRK